MSTDHEGRQRVWWRQGLFWKPNGWAWPQPQPLWSGMPPPPGAVELVPCAARDDIRVDLDRAIWAGISAGSEFPIAAATDAVLALLSDRGLVK
jgi:hypothetical protein